MTRVLRPLLVLLATLALGACVTSAPRPGAGPDQEVLKQRALQRWNLLIAHQADKAWDYLTPGYRQTTSQAEYADAMNNRPLQWKAAAVNKVECATPDSCIVYVLVTYSLRLPGMGGDSDAFAPIKERWLYLQDQWYHLPREDEGKGFKSAR